MRREQRRSIINMLRSVRPVSCSLPCIIRPQLLSHRLDTRPSNKLEKALEVIEIGQLIQRDLALPDFTRNNGLAQIRRDLVHDSKDRLD